MTDKQKKETAADTTKKHPDTSKPSLDTINASELLSSDATTSTGASILLKKDMGKNERFPMLDVVFDKFVQYLSLNLRNFLQANTEVQLLDVRSNIFNEYLGSISLPAMFNIFKIKDWESAGVIILNNNMIYSLINILLGGKKYNRNAQEKSEGRIFSTLEFNIVERFINLALEDLKNSFSFLYPVQFSLERQESSPKLISTISNNSAVIVCSIKIDIGEFNGVLDLVIPHTSLDPIREELLKKHVGETFGQPNTWRPFLTQELLHTDIELSAILMEEQMLLSDVLEWKAGTTLNIDIHKLDEIALRCDDISLGVGKLGHHNGMVAIEMENITLNEPSQQ